MLEQVKVEETKINQRYYVNSTAVNRHEKSFLTIVIILRLQAGELENSTNDNIQSMGRRYKAH